MKDMISIIEELSPDKDLPFHDCFRNKHKIFYAKSPDVCPGRQEMQSPDYSFLYPICPMNTLPIIQPSQRKTLRQ